MNRGEAKAWFVDQASEFTTERAKLDELWELAKAGRDDDKPLSAWKVWIEWCCAESRGGGARSAIAIFASKLRTTDPENGPPRGRPEEPYRTISNQTPEEAAEFKARARAARTEDPEPSPPMRYFLPLCKRMSGEKAWSQLKREWEEQGEPFPEDFDPAPLGLVRQ